LEDVKGDRALLRIKKATTDSEAFPVEYLQPLKDTEDLATILKDTRLRGYRIVEIVEAGNFSSVIFENDIRLVKGEETTFERETGQKPLRRTEENNADVRPVFNLIDRAAKATGLTRKTVNQIFKGLSVEFRESFLKNPEGFANLFIDTLQETFADHIVKHIEFKSDPGSFQDLELEEMFPPIKDFPQKELLEAGDAGMYDWVQVDSDVERKFVENYLSDNDPKLIGYFKFPPRYKIDLPKIIGNYNPDWGILRYDDDGKVVLKLIRETKGREDTSLLRFANEGRKIEAARKHFTTLGLDYRVVTDTTYDWYEPEYMRGLRNPRLPYNET
jgi:type III restriction enzyme